MAAAIERPPDKEKVMFTATNANAFVGRVTDESIGAHMASVYRHVCAGTALTAFVALLASKTSFSHSIYTHDVKGHLAFTGLGFVFLLLPIVMLLGAMVANPGRWSATGTRAFFYTMTACLGVTLSSALMIYSGTDVVRALFITTGAFAGLSIYGYTTHRNLGPIGAAAMVALTGLVLTLLVAALFGMRLPEFWVSLGSLGIFSVLTASDTQDAKNRFIEDPADGSRIAVWSALSLYLDFLNMFMDILRLTGNSSDD